MHGRKKVAVVITPTDEEKEAAIAKVKFSSVQSTKFASQECSVKYQVAAYRKLAGKLLDARVAVIAEPGVAVIQVALMESILPYSSCARLNEAVANRQQS